MKSWTMPAHINPTLKAIPIDAIRGKKWEQESWDNHNWKDAWRHEVAVGGVELIKGLHDGADATAVKCQILIVAPDSTTRLEVGGMLADLDHELTESRSTEDAMKAISVRGFDLILIDLKMPEIRALELCEALRRSPSTRAASIFIHSAQADPEMEARAITAGADEFLVAPLNRNAFRARVQASLRHKGLIESLDDSESVLFALARSVEDRDPDLGQHCQRLAIMGAAMGLAIGLPDTAVRTLQRAGYVHDIGKIGIPDRILFKAGPLTLDEWVVMKSHTERGEKICAPIKSMAAVLPIVRHHHERWDGSGYPDHLKGEQTPLLARVLQIVDIYDALTTERPYKRAFSPEQAVAILREEALKGWRDPVLVELFADLLPMFRAPSVMDTSHTSLLSLAAALEAYRKDSHGFTSAGAANFRYLAGLQVG